MTLRGRSGASEPRAEAPRAPVLSPAMRQAEAEHEAYLRDRRTLERRSVLRGLVLLAIVVLVFALWRGGVTRVFYPGWWRQW